MLLAFAVERRAAAPLLLGARPPPLSIDISCPHGTQQQTRRTPRLRLNDGTHRPTDGRSTASQTLLHILCEQCKQDSIALSRPTKGWLGSRVVIVLDSGAEEPGFKSQSRRCRVTVLGKLFTPVVPLFTEQQNW